MKINSSSGTPSNESSSQFKFRDDFHMETDEFSYNEDEGIKEKSKSTYG
jgi:hypothetical protein